MQDNSILSKNISPLQIALGLGIIQVISIFLSQYISTNPRIAWEVAFTFLLLFSLVNCMFSLNSKDPNKFWIQSIIAFVLYSGIGGLVAWQVSGTSIYDLESLKFMYVIFTFIFLVLMTIIRTMRKIIELAQKHDSRLNEFKR
jgi:hypothetical protein